MSDRTLRINWVEGRPSLSGGVKSNRLLAEAMARRGHSITICHLPPTLPWPPVWRVRSFYKRWKMNADPDRFRHHLEQAEVPTFQFPRRELDGSKAPDADVTIASWWKVWRDVSAWPASKGVKIHLVRGHETFGGDEEEVHAAYRIPGPKAVISIWLERIMRDYGHQDIIRIPNGIKWSQFDSPPRGKQDRPTVGLLMSTEPIKDTHIGLEAVRLLQGRFPNLRVIGFGQKPMLDSWPLPANLEFHCQPAQTLIPKLYQSCDCWITPSRSEGFGMPGLEAAAGHCPVVSTRCGGPEDYVREGVNGSMVDIGDARGIADAVERILRLDDAAWRMMSAASYEIARDFDWDRSAAKLEANLYRWIDEGARA